MKNILVTGADGFIGKPLVMEALEQGYFVYAVGTSETIGIDSPNLTYKKAFFEDYPGLADWVESPIDCIFHLAWQGVFGNAFKDYALQLKNASNAGMTAELAVKLKARKFVLASTVNVLELLKGNGPEKPRYTVCYSSSKLVAEMICRTICLNNGVEFNCGLLAMTYGPNNPSLMVTNVVIKDLINGKSPNLIKGNGLYDLLYVGDTVKGLLAIGDKGISPKHYYVGHRSLRTFREIFEEIGQIINPKIPMNFGAYPDENSIDYSLIDIEELRRDTGFVPTSDFKETIIATAESLKGESK